MCMYLFHLYVNSSICSDEDSRGKMMALTIKKRRDSDDSTAWWSGVLEGDDKW